MTDALKKLLEAAKTAQADAVTPAKQQRRSFVYGNTHFENELITREMVDREAETAGQGEKMTGDERDRRDSRALEPELITILTPRLLRSSKRLSAVRRAIGAIHSA